MARTWRHRWLVQERELPPSERLQDAERSGAPATLVWSKWLNCLRLPIERNYGRAISHWTEENWRMRWSSSASWSISRHVGRLLQEALKPHQIRYWLTPPDEEFDAKVSDITFT